MIRITKRSVRVRTLGFLVVLLASRSSTSFETGSPSLVRQRRHAFQQHYHPLQHQEVLMMGQHSRDDDTSEAPNPVSLPLWSRKQLLISCGGAMLSFGLGCINRPEQAVADDDAEAAGSTAADSVSIVPCRTDGSNANCISTASVRNIKLYMPPWTYPDTMPVEEVMARLKGAVSTDSLLSVQEQTGETILRVKATRNFSTDELLFIINADDHVITFSSNQIEGPDASDFGAQRKRLEDLKRRIGVFKTMGEEYGSADSGPKEGAFGQLKAFYGLQSGSGFEGVLLNEED